MEIYFEVAKLGFYNWLSDKGFSGGYQPEQDTLPPDAITRTMLNAFIFRWFREVYKLEGDSFSRAYVKNNPTLSFAYMITDINNFSDYLFHTEDEGIAFLTITRAETACIEKMIEIVKERRHNAK